MNFGHGSLSGDLSWAGEIIAHKCVHIAIQNQNKLTDCTKTLYVETMHVVYVQCI